MRLIFTSAPSEGRVVELTAARLTIGRVPGNDLQLDGQKVSRHHAVIEVHDRQAVLRDLGSRNGTYVDGVRLSGAHVLSGGERLRFGDQQLRVQAGPDAAPAVPGATAIEPAAAPIEPPAAPIQRPAAAPVEPALAAGEPEPAPADRAGAGGFALRRLIAAHRARAGVLAVLALALIVVFGVAQLVLPGVAEQRLRSQLARYGPVRRVHVESTPAVKLLWHHADRVEVAMDSYRSEPGGHGSLADFLSRTRDTGKLDVRVGTLHTQLLTLHDVRLHKQGSALVGQALLTQPDLSAALPSFLDLRPVSASQNGIVLQATATVFGHSVRADVGVRAEAGRVVVRPEGFPFGSLATITVFGDPRVYVESLGAELRGQEYLLTARAALR